MFTLKYCGLNEITVASLWIYEACKVHLHPGLLGFVRRVSGVHKQ
jgi:hypothetical protein